MTPHIVDARGQRCPGPIIALAKATRELPGGSRITLLSDDPGADADVPAWCRLKGVDFITSHACDDGSGTAYLVVLPG